ncbi:MAG: tRNA (adenosine(37)-N6)-threonylcarbamoyltransferase complex ATPase subunit type 1 TsaE [Christensenellales bacterium]|jgi:tRNA threonylcarbamoyladenosine biosynthesis protein TsaE
MQVVNKEAMNALGVRLASRLASGDTVLLTGQMGAGKSELARGIARGLGYAGPIPSPTFTILNQYEGGREKLYHFDWYRIDDVEELYASGLDEVIGYDGITLIEWHQRAPELCPEDALEVVITVKDNDVRVVELISRGNFRSVCLEEL